MSVRIQARYLGNKKTEATHEPSGAKLITTPPLDNEGDGSSFSPTDLLATALGTCMLSVMAIVADRDGFDMSGAWMEVEKHMSTDIPRRIAALPVTIHLPAALLPDERHRLELAAEGCPVSRSINPVIDSHVTFVYDVGA
jgi:putative redox protein